jgi:hypothetical protein
MVLALTGERQDCLRPKGTTSHTEAIWFDSRARTCFAESGSTRFPQVLQSVLADTAHGLSFSLSSL